MELADVPGKPDSTTDVSGSQAHSGAEVPGTVTGLQLAVGQVSPDDSTLGLGPSAWLRNVVQAARPSVAVTARGTLPGRSRSRTDPQAEWLTFRQVSQLVDDAFSGFGSRMSDFPAKPTQGNLQDVTRTALTPAFLNAQQTAGIERDYDIQLTGDTCWGFRGPWGGLTKGETRILSRDPVRRVQLSVSGFLTSPFDRPGYGSDDVERVKGRSLDGQRCPLAEDLGARGSTDLCTVSWCNVDYALAETWGAALQRSGSLVDGADHWDVRFRTKPPDPHPQRCAALRKVLHARGIDHRRRHPARRAAAVFCDRLDEHRSARSHALGDYG